ncbi:MAG: HAD-IC family P-type ATPase, partial [Burkholderiales bacterium]
KDAEAVLRPDTPIAERITMVYLGTAVVAGSGLALVAATGQATELGGIGQLVALVPHRETPLEREVERLGRRLIVLALAICGVVGLAGILQGEPIWLMLETAVTLAIAAIPEGLPAVTAVALASGLWRLARRGALVRRLHAVETLGSTTIICADKTGTMTENRLTVTRIRLDDRDIRVEGGSLSRRGEFVEGGTTIAVADDPHLPLALTVGALVNNASLEPAGSDDVALHGDPTEGALLVAALKGGIGPSDLARQWPRLREIPFDPATRLMATVNRSPDGKPVAFLKGAPGRVVEASTFRLTPAGAVPLTDADRAGLLEANRALAGEGLRVLALA